MLDRFAELLDSHQRVLLSTHENPDADALGAAIGLAHYLRARGKETRIVVFPQLPNFLEFLDTESWVEAFDGRPNAGLAAWPDLWLLVDASDPERFGKLLPTFRASQAAKACIDHHLQKEEKGFDLVWADPAASASSELVYELALRHMPKPLPRSMLDALYTGIVDDTGSFRFSNATAKVHRIAAEMIEQGVRPDRIYQALYHQGSPAKLKIFGRAFQSLRMLHDEQVGLMTISQQDLNECGAIHEDLEGLVNKPLELKGVEVSGLLYETEDGLIKVSLRSREFVNVNVVCRNFGGGGHRLASGAKIEGPMLHAMERVANSVISQLEKDLSRR